MGFHPVSSHRGQGIVGIQGAPASVQMAAQLCAAPQLVLRARLDLPDALARQMQPVADLLQRARLVVFEPESQPHDLALLAVEITEGGLELAASGLMNHLVLDWRDAVLPEQA